MFYFYFQSQFMFRVKTDDGTVGAASASPIHLANKLFSTARNRAFFTRMTSITYTRRL